MKLPGRALCLLMAFAVLFCSFGVASASVTGNVISEGDFDFRISGSEAELIKYYPSGADTVQIPGSVQGYSVTAIGDAVFKGTPIKSVTIGEGIARIGKQAFYNCPELISITFPQSLESIDEMALSNCYSLKTVEIPQNVESIGPAAFANCTSMESFRIAEGNPYYTAKNNVVFSKDETKLLFYLQVGERSYTVPDGVTTIGENAFSGREDLEEVIFPQGLLAIEKYAFSGCSDLLYVTIPDSVVSLGLCAFRGCSKLQTVGIGNGVTSIPDYTFSACGGFDSLVLGDGVQTVGSMAFVGCRSIGSLTIPDSLICEKETFAGITVQTVRFFTTKQKNAMQDYFPGSVIICLCRGEHILSNTERGKCTLCDYRMDLSHPPVLVSVTHDTVKLEPQPGYEFSYDGIHWNSSGVFTELLPNMEYHFCSRLAATDVAVPGPNSDPLTVTTDKAPQSKAEPPRILQRDAYSVTLEAQDGYEYSMDCVSWQANPVFTGLDPNQSYAFYQRKAASNTHYAGPASDAAFAGPAGVSELTSSIYKVEQGLIRRIPVNTTVATILSGLDGGEYCRVYHGDELQMDTACVGTGMTVKLYCADEVIAEYVIVVTGDVNGDSGISVTDMIAIKAHLLGKSELTGLSALAADTNGSADISITDFVQIKAHLLGKSDITPN